MWNAECGMWNMHCGMLRRVWNAVHRVLSVERKMWTVCVINADDELRKKRGNAWWEYVLA